MLPLQHLSFSPFPSPRLSGRVTGWIPTTREAILSSPSNRRRGHRWSNENTTTDFLWAHTRLRTGYEGRCVKWSHRRTLIRSYCQEKTFSWKNHSQLESHVFVCSFGLEMLAWALVRVVHYIENRVPFGTTPYCRLLLKMEHSPDVLISLHFHFVCHSPSPNPHFNMFNLHPEGLLVLLFTKTTCPVLHDQKWRL